MVNKLYSVYYALALILILGVMYAIYAAIYFYKQYHCLESVEVRRNKKTKERLLQDSEKFDSGHTRVESGRIDP